jgi:hypothetical protein
MPVTKYLVSRSKVSLDIPEIPLRRRYGYGLRPLPPWRVMVSPVT